MPYIKTPRLNFYYERAGKGPRVLFLSGVCGDLRNKPNVLDSVLAEHFEVLAFDQRGTGRTDKPEEPYTLLDYAEDAVALMDALEWPSARVMGVSFGGMVAQELAIRYPDRVNALALCCTTAGGEGGSSYPLHELIGMEPELRARKMMAIGDMRRNEDWQAANPKETAELLEMSANSASPFLQEPGGQASYERQLWARSQHNTYDRLGKIQAPTLVCAGRYDAQAKIEAVRNLQQAIAGAELQQFEGGHAFLAQDPKAYEAIKAFFTGP